MRSSWKFGFVNLNCFKSNIIKFRNSLIINDFVEKVFNIYSGKQYVNLLVSDLMVGHKFGEFCLTKKLGQIIHSENRLHVKKRKKFILSRQSKNKRKDKKKNKRKKK